jgi:hypothetical protein
VSLPVRHAVRARHQRRPGVRRASARISAGRVVAVVLALLTAGALYGVTASRAFALDRVELTGARFTTQAAVEAIAGIDVAAHPNLFTLDTTVIADRVRELPTVVDARVHVGLPDRLTIEVVEREPILVWQVGGRSVAVASDGQVLGFVSVNGVKTAAASPSPSPKSGKTAKATRSPQPARTTATPRPSAATPGASPAAPASGGALPSLSLVANSLAEGGALDDLPVFVDQRKGSAGLAHGERLDAGDLAVARRLGALTPKIAGSKAKTLVFTITDADGFVVSTGPSGWRAIFGIYTSTLRSAGIIPSQVRCLANLLADRSERTIETVYLFPDGDRCGTFTSRGGSNAASPSPGTAVDASAAAGAATGSSAP